MKRCGFSIKKRYVILLALTMALIMLTVGFLFFGRAKTKETYLDYWGEPVPADDWAVRYRRISHYDRKGCCLYSEVYELESGELHQRTEYHYTEGKYPAASTVYDSDGARRHFQVRDEWGRIIKDTWFNTAGNVRGWAVHERDAEGHITDTYEYDASGILTEHSVYTMDAEGNRISQTVNTYDAEGHITGSTVYNADGTVKRMP